MTFRPLVLLTLLATTATLTAPHAGAGVAAGPVVDAVAPASSARSGRIVITGSGFGAGYGTVRVAGLDAPVTRWTDTRIVAYVPEAAPLGVGPVQVVAPSGTASGTLDVTERPAANGRILWRFQGDAPYFFHRPALGPDGTIYAHDVYGFLYALAPDGGLKWIYRGPGGGTGTVGVTLDGTIVIGGGNVLDGVNPDGTRRWRWTDPNSQGVIAGPSVGPDGNVYAVFDLLGVGAVSLTQAGQVRWTTSGNPRFTQYGQLGQEIAFSPTQLHVAFDEATQNPQGVLYGLRLDGSQRFAVSGNFEVEPEVGPNGDVYNVTTVGPVLQAFSSSGALRWTFPKSFSFSLEAPDVGSDGTIYTVGNMSVLEAVTPAGAEKWAYASDTHLYAPIVSPSGDLVVLGGQVTFGEPGVIKGVGADGNLRWRIDLPNEGPFCLVPSTRARFTADSSTAYLGVQRLCASPDEDYSYLYAISTGDSQPPETDTVQITRATYRGSRDRLRIDATSSSSSATVKAYVTSTDALIGTLTNLGSGSYTGTFQWPSNPKQVTVRSSVGGSATRAVTRQ